MQDPLDKPPSLPKTIQRIQETIYSFFKANSRLVWRGCAISLQEIFENCFPVKSAPVLGYQSAAHFIFDPLLSMLTAGTNPVQMQGASFCIKYLIEYFLDQRESASADLQLEMIDIVEKLHQPLLQSTTKYQVDNESQLGTIQTLIERLGIRVVVTEHYNHMDGLVKLCLKATGQLSKPPQKRAAYDLIAVLGENL